MRKILVLSYQISPVRGSEYSVGWNYVVNMSRNNSLTVLYGASGNHLGDINELENHIKINPIKNVRFIPVIPNKETEKLNSLNKRGIFVYSFYLAFHSWHNQVYKVTKELIKNERFDLIHYLTPIGYREPGYLWKFNIPYIWGPIGGTQSVPVVLMNSLSTGGKLKLGFRKVANYFQLRFNRQLKKSIRNTDVLIASTTTDQHFFEEIYKKKTYYLPENGIVGEILNEQKKIDVSKPIELIWVGRIDSNKALSLLLQALQRIKNKKKIYLNVIGDGPLKQSLSEYVIENGLSDIVCWRGKLPRHEVFKYFKKAHLHVISSLTEANTTVIWEAMANGVPTLSLDHCGMHDTICEKCGVKIPIKSLEQVISDMANAIDDLVTNPHKLQLLSSGVYDCAQKYTWDKRIVFFNRIYDEAIDNFKERNS